MMAEILIDIDDVSAQFRRSYIESINHVLGREFLYENTPFTDWDIDKSFQFTNYERARLWKYINSLGWAQRLELMPGAGDAIEALASRHEVVFVSKPLKTSATWVNDRYKWVRKHFGVTLATEMISTAAKYRVDGDFLIEDRVGHATEWMRVRTLRSPHRRHQPILYAWPYNDVPEAANIPRLPDWKTIVEWIDR